MPLASGLKDFTYFGKQGNAELVLIEQSAELEQGSAVWNALASQINVHKLAQTGHVQQRILAGIISQIEPVLHEVHALQPNGGASALTFGVVGFDHFAQLCPGHNVVHGLEEGIALGGPAVLLESSTLVSGHGQCFLLHQYLTQQPTRRWTFFSVALMRVDKTGNRRERSCTLRFYRACALIADAEGFRKKMSATCVSAQ